MDALYGLTNDLERHVAKHKGGKSGFIAARYNVTRLFHFEQFDDIRECDWRRDRDPRMPRAQKIALIESMNPQRLDVSEE